jgi:hypothetical protein
MKKSALILMAAVFTAALAYAGTQTSAATATTATAKQSGQPGGKWPAKKRQANEKKAYPTLAPGINKQPKKTTALKPPPKATPSVK